MMNSVPSDRRGADGGMIATFQNSAFVLSIGIFFTLAFYVAGRGFFPHLITAPFHSGLGVAFGFAIAANAIAAIASALTGKRKQLTAAPESPG